MISDFERDLITILTYTEFNHDNHIRFVLRHADRLKGDVSQMDLSERANNALHRARLGTFEELRPRINDSHFKVRQAGVKTIKEVKNKYLRYYYDTLNDMEREEFWRDSINATEITRR